ncbi:unnamed protein product, partial [Rotaria magnacalcarata]
MPPERGGGVAGANGQQAAKIFVPRSIQQIKDTEIVAFVKRVDLEIPDNRITEALTKVGLDVANVTRLNRKEGNIPTSTIKITFKDANNRNTFIHTGLQVDSMHFNAEAASENKKSVQCYICHQYNHVAKYCKTKQQICAKCCDNHCIEQFTAANDAIKCNNCKGKHLATAYDCPNFLEQEKRMLNLINQYSSTSSATTTTLLLHDSNEFPSLPNMYQRQQGLLHNDILDELINLLTKDFKKIEETISSVETLINDDATSSSSSFSDSDEDVQISERPFSLLGYNIFRNDRVGKAGGGVLLAVKEHIKCQEIINKTTHKNEIIAVQIETLLYKSILISSIHVTPTAKIDMNIFEELYSISNNCIIVGDLNATLSEMGSTKTNARGKQLQELLNEGIIDCVDDDSTTFEKNEYEAKLDWILGSHPLLSFITNVETHPTIGTINGHKPLTFDIKIGAEPKPTSPRLSLNFKEAKWTKFRSKLDQQLVLWNNDLSLNSPLNIEDYSMFITNSIMLATKEAVPTPTPTNKSYPLSEASKSLITLKHQAYRRWKRTGDNTDK